MTAHSQLDPQLTLWLENALSMGQVMAALQGQAPERVLAGDGVIADYLQALGKQAMLAARGCPRRCVLSIEHLPMACQECPLARHRQRAGRRESRLFLPWACDSEGVERNLFRLARELSDPDAGILARQRFREAMAGLKTAPGSEGLSVLCLVSQGPGRLALAGRDTPWQRALDAMGLVNWARGLSGYQPLTGLDGAYCQPDAMLILEAWRGQSLAGDWLWLSELRAWQRGRVLWLGQEELALWGPSMPDRLRRVREHLSGA
ncbi:MAG: hypothetical protein R3296_10575 [Oleiphilaceae bacterium]|nr:hypothetical protein [Oleiphilaceae bacterium]